MLKQRIAATVALVGILLFSPVSRVDADAPEKRVVPSSDNAALTLYQNGLGLVAEKRRVSLDAGSYALTLAGLPATSVSGSLRLSGDGIDIRRMHERLQPLSRQVMLESALGSAVQLIRTDPETGDETVVDARLVALESGWPILEIDGRIELNPPGRIVFPSLDADTLNRPAVDVFGSVAKSGEQLIDVRYLASGIGWQVNYEMILTGTEDEPRLDVIGWAQIVNNLGREYIASPLRLVAGDINRVSPPGGGFQPQADMMRMSVAAEAEPMPERAASNDAHIYTIDGAVDLPMGSSQVRLFHRTEVVAERRYILDGEPQLYWGPQQLEPRPTNPAIEVSFRNTGDEPLPSGGVRVYADNTAGDGGRLIGEAHIPGVPADSRATFRTGRAFDVRATRLQTEFRRTNTNLNVYESGHKITLTNAKTTDVIVEVREPVAGEWEIIRESHGHMREGLTPVWRVTVPAGGSTVLTYTVRVRR